MESLPLPQDHPTASTHSFQRKPSDSHSSREDHKSNKLESSKGDITKDSIPPSSQKYHPNPPPTASRSSDYSYHRSSYNGSSSQHASRAAPGSPPSHRAPIVGAPPTSRTILPIGPRSWSSHKSQVGPPTNESSNTTSAKELGKYSHPDSHDDNRDNFSPAAHTSAPFNSSLATHPKVPSDPHTPSHSRGGLISGPTLNTPASEVFKSPLPLSVPITIPPPAPPPPPPSHLKPAQVPNSIPQPGSTTPKASIPSGSLSPTVNFNKSGVNPQLGSPSPSPISSSHAKAPTSSNSGPNNSSLRNEISGGPTSGHASNGFQGSMGSPSIGTGTTSMASKQQLRVNNYPSPKHFAGYPSPGYPVGSNTNLPGSLPPGPPPPPPPVLVDKELERAQRMLDVCPGLSQEISKLRSTRNSGMLSAHLSSQISAHKAVLDLNWQASELKTVSERRKLAEAQLEKLGGGISLGMGF